MNPNDHNKQIKLQTPSPVPKPSNAANDLINKYRQSRNQISTQANEDVKTLKHENNEDIFNPQTGVWDDPVINTSKRDSISDKILTNLKPEENVWA